MNFTNIKTYADLAETCGALILCNGMGDLELELINIVPVTEFVRWYESHGDWPALDIETIGQTP